MLQLFGERGIAISAPAHVLFRTFSDVRLKLAKVRNAEPAFVNFVDNISTQKKCG
jgi:hypothetical protein